MNVALFVRIVVPNSISFLTDDVGSGNILLDDESDNSIVAADDESTFRFF